MELLFEDEFRLEDCVNKCRFCFRTLIDEQNFVQVTKKIEKSFRELTSMQLISAGLLSTRICSLCNKDLNIFSQFRRDLTQKQTVLYKKLEEEQPEFANILNEVKSEVNEFINCDPELADGDNFLNPQIIIKSEMEMEGLVGAENDFLEYSNQQRVERSRNLTCKECNFKARSYKFLRLHITKFHRAQNLQCDICFYVTNFKSDLELHMKSSHIKKEQQNFYCEFCSQEFDKRHLLNRHIKMKHTEKQREHSCVTCDKSFFTISTLKKHVESHREKNMPCEFCGRLFSCMNNLRTHLYYHSDPKFVCEFEGCGKKFFMRKLLRAHMNVHKGQKDFGCSYCDKSYFFQSHLKRHILSTHMKLKIDCEVLSCSSSFARKETYRNHVLQHHQNIGQEALNLLLMKIRSMKVEEYRCVG